MLLPPPFGSVVTAASYPYDADPTKISPEIVTGTITVAYEVGIEIQWQANDLVNSGKIEGIPVVSAALVLAMLLVSVIL